MRGLLRLGIVAFAGLLLACRTECAADGKAGAAQLEREQKAMLRGQGICRELLTPKLDVVDDRIVLTASRENVLAKRSDVPASTATIFAPLDERLSGYRTHFKAVRADPFDAKLYVTFDAGLEPVRAITLLATAAHAGYTRSKVHAGNVEVDLDWWLPPPEEGSVLCVDPRGERGFTLRFEPAQGPEIESASVETLAADVGRACAGRAPCASAIGIGERAGTTFPDMLRVAAAALGQLKERTPRVVLVARAPADPFVMRRPCVSVR